MENEKKAYEPIEIIKVEFDARDRITASGCDIIDQTEDVNVSFCWIA